jgi:hypothetical protein
MLMNEGGNAVLNRIAQIQAEIVQTARDDRNVRGLNRSSWLRAEPDQSASRIRKLFPDELVWVRTAQDTWVEVEMFDYGGGSSTVLSPPSDAVNGRTFTACATTSSCGLLVSRVLPCSPGDGWSSLALAGSPIGVVCCVTAPVASTSPRPASPAPPSSPPQKPWSTHSDLAQTSSKYMGSDQWDLV